MAARTQQKGRRWLYMQVKKRAYQKTLDLVLPATPAKKKKKDSILLYI
jgi:hypothetical protein